MTIKIDYSQFKSSGVYTLEFDASESIVLNTQTIRLVVGFSRKGPFNSPVYLPDKKTARRVFGDIDPFLERRGCFFHRSLYTCLDVAPIFGLNLMMLNNDPDTGDKVPFMSYSLSMTEKNGVPSQRMFASYFNKERFWFADERYLIGAANLPGSPNAGKLFHIVNLSQVPISVMIRKTKVQGFDVTANEFFTGVGREIPSYIDKDDYIGDFFVEMFLIQGDWSNYRKLSTDPTFNEYFDIRGLKKSKLREWLALSEVSVVASFIGCILPDIQDGNGVVHSIDVQVNNSYASTGVLIALDKDRLEDYDAIFANESDEDTYSAVDMIGHNLANVERVNPDIIDFLSYRTAIKEKLNFKLDRTFNIYKQAEGGLLLNGPNDASTISVRIGRQYGLFNNVLKIRKPFEDETIFTVDEYNETFAKSIPGQSLIKLISGKWAKIENKYRATETNEFGETNEFMFLTYSHPNKAIEREFRGSPFTINIPLTNTGIPTITIRKVDVPNQYKIPTNLFIDPCWYGKPGEDILIENRRARLGYYIKISGNPVFDNPANPTTVTIPFREIDIPALQLIKNAQDGYLALWGGKEKVNLADLEFCFKPDLFKFVYEAGDKGSTKFTISGLNINIKGVDLLDPTKFNTVSYYPRRTSSTEYGCIGLYRRDGNGVFDKVHYLNLTASFNSSIDFLDTNADTIRDTAVLHIADPDGVLPNIDLAGETWEIYWQFTKQNYMIAYKYSLPYEYYTSSALLPGDRMYYSPTSAYYIDYDQSTDADAIPVLKIFTYDTYDPRLGNFDLSFTAARDSGSFVSEHRQFQRDQLIPDPVEFFGLWIYTSADKLYDSIEIFGNNALRTTFNINIRDANNIQVGQYIVSQQVDEEGNSTYRMTRVVRKIKLQDGTGFQISTLLPVYIQRNGTLAYIIRYFQIENFIQNYQLTHLSGFKLTDFHLPGGLYKQRQLDKILSMLDPINTNLQEMLKSRDIITFRYLVDTFDGAIGPMTGPKVYMTRVAQARQKCMALMNAPSMREFSISNDPRFTEDITRIDPIPILNTEYIASGGNQSLGPENLFSLPDDNNGAKFSGYFTPFLTIRENGKNIHIPPAADVSNNFVRKFINGFPFAIVAGPRRGFISNPKMVSVEYDFTQRDRNNLEPFGLNPIVKIKNQGWMIFGNQMAYQRTRTAFNNLHVRDLLITIEEAIEDILFNYLFEFNDPATRLEIKTLVEGYMDTVRAQGAVYNFAVIMDETNNTPEIIDQNRGIIDVAIEPARGLHQIINRVTVYKTGGIASGGFVNFI